MQLFELMYVPPILFLKGARLNTLSAAGIDYSFETLFRTQTLLMTDSIANSELATHKISCTVTVNLDFCTRFDIAVIISGLSWLIADQNVGNPLVQCAVLEALRLSIMDKGIIMPALPTSIMDLLMLRLFSTSMDDLKGSCKESGRRDPCELWFQGRLFQRR